MSNSAPVVLYATFTAQADRADTIAALLRDYGLKVKMEPGNATFEASRLRDNPDKFFVFEVYSSEAAFQAHLGSSYCGEFNAALEPLIAEPASQLTFLRRL